MNGQTARRAWLAGVGVAAATAGAWWYGRDGIGPPSGAGQAGVPPGTGDELWTLRLPRPEGGELVMADLRGAPLLLNFWATWCPPCIKELPEIDRFARDHAARLKVVGLAIDSLGPVQEFLKRQPVGFAIGLAGFGGTELSRSLGNGSGVLPFTALLDARGAVAQRKIGQTSYDELKGWASQL